MTVASHCGNCKAPLPPDQPADNRYCGTCTAAWQGGPTTSPVAGTCANCKTPLPTDQPTDNRYCAKCTAAWQRGQSTRT